MAIIPLNYPQIISVKPTSKELSVRQLMKAGRIKEAVGLPPTADNNALKKALENIGDLTPSQKAKILEVDAYCERFEKLLGTKISRRKPPMPTIREFLSKAVHFIVRK